MPKRKCEPEYLTVKEVSEIYNISRSLIYELMASRKIKRIKVGRKTLIERQSVNSWLEVLYERQTAHISEGAKAHKEIPVLLSK